MPDSPARTATILVSFSHLHAPRVAWLAPEIHRNHPQASLGGTQLPVASTAPRQLSRGPDRGKTNVGDPECVNEQRRDDRGHPAGCRPSNVVKLPMRSAAVFADQIDGPLQRRSLWRWPRTPPPACMRLASYDCMVGRRSGKNVRHVSLGMAPPLTDSRF